MFFCTTENAEKALLLLFLIFPLLWFPSTQYTIQKGRWEHDTEYVSLTRIRGSGFVLPKNAEIEEVKQGYAVLSHFYSGAKVVCDSHTWHSPLDGPDTYSGHPRHSFGDSPTRGLVYHMWECKKVQSELHCILIRIAQIANMIAQYAVRRVEQSIYQFMGHKNCQMVPIYTISYERGDWYEYTTYVFLTPWISKRRGEGRIEAEPVFFDSHTAIVSKSRKQWLVLEGYGEIAVTHEMYEQYEKEPNQDVVVTFHLFGLWKTINFVKN